jgi:hypothetical protein
MKTLKGLTLALITTFTLAGCGGGGDGGGTEGSNNNPVVTTPPAVSQVSVTCQCASCLVAITAESSSPIKSYTATFNQVNPPALTSQDWSPAASTSTLFQGTYSVKVTAATCLQNAMANFCGFVVDTQNRIASRCVTASYKY